jgi:hypothetical protein
MGSLEIDKKVIDAHERASKQSLPNLERGRHVVGNPHDETVSIDAFTASADRDYVLVFERDTARRVDLPARGEIVVGRAEEATLRLHDASVSRRRCRSSTCDGGPLPYYRDI